MAGLSVARAAPNGDRGVVICGEELEDSSLLGGGAGCDEEEERVRAATGVAPVALLLLRENISEVRL